MPDLMESVALEYYEYSLGAQKPEKGKCFSLRVPIALPAELSAFVGRHLNEPASAEIT